MNVLNITCQGIFRFMQSSYYCSFILKFVKVYTKCMINLMHRKLVDSKLGHFWIVTTSTVNCVGLQFLNDFGNL